MPTHRSLAALVAVLALPFVMGPGRCGFLIDYTETILVSEPFERVVIAADDGSVVATSYRRGGALIKRHVSGFEPSMGVVEHRVEDDALVLEARCKYEGNCSFDHMIEAPQGVGFEVTMIDAQVSLGYVDGDIEVELRTGWFRGVRLDSPNVAVSVEEGDVTLDHAVAPESVTISVGVGDVSIELPAGAYRCELSTGEGELDTADITCDDAATAVLSVEVQTGDITVKAVTP